MCVLIVSDDRSVDQRCVVRPSIISLINRTMMCVWRHHHLMSSIVGLLAAVNTDLVSPMMVVPVGCSVVWLLSGLERTNRHYFYHYYY